MRHEHHWTAWNPDGIGWSRKCVAEAKYWGCGAFQYRKALPGPRAPRQKPRLIQEWIDELRIKVAQDMQLLAKPRKCASCGQTVAASRAYRKIAILGAKLERAYKGMPGNNPREYPDSTKAGDGR